jgi:[ribosomal protein S5]-alanine N-acetyltransferase
MLQLNFTPFPTIVTERLLLRALTTDDVNEIFTLRSNEGLLIYLDKAPEKSVEETFLFIESIKKNIENNDSILWGIALKESGIIVGTICYWRIEKQHYRAEIGYVLNQAEQGKGIMDEAIKAVLKYGFETMQLHSVEANINPANASSRKVLIKNGFVKEAYFRENYYYNGKFIDSEIYSLITPVK